MTAVITEDIAKANISANIHRLLDERGENTRWLVFATQEPPNTIYRVARGENVPNAVTLARIAEALAVTVDDLLSTPPQKNSRRTA